MNGTDLLAQFKESRSEEAFRQLVRRYTNLVYSVSKRRIADASLAQEVTQLVFIRLAKAAPKLSGDAELAAWLHRTTVNASIDLWRSESRRRAREEQAVAMQANPAEDEIWTELAPQLDEALNQLTDADRQAILLRFFDEKSMRELGALFGVSEDAAKMRVSRALDRLRQELSTRGIACGAVALATVMTDRAVESAPTAFAAALATFSFPISASLSSGSGILGALAQVSRAKLAAGVAGIIVIGAASLVLLRFQTGATRIVRHNAAESVASNSAQSEQLAGAAADAGAADDEREPDPLKLLQGVARARQRITSGSMEFQLSREHFNGRSKETNQVRLIALFDGQKLRCESFDREYSYIGQNDVAEAAELRIQRENLDHEAAVRAGLIKPFESHHTVAYDGTAVFDYWETDGKSESMTIKAPSEGGSLIFDPRCLGLRTWLFAESTVESCLSYTEAKSIYLAGREFVEGDPAWHVRVHSKYDSWLDFWIDVAHPERLLKQAYGQNVAVSKYSDATAIPTEVTTIEYQNGSPLFRKRFIRSNAQLNVRVDPASFTLAGLGLPVGTDVSDNRIHRRIGYWTGTGLSERLPTKKGKSTEPQTTRSLVDLMAVLENDPASEAAREAATSILLNTPDGPDVETAAGVILREHVQSPDLANLCNEMERLRHRCAKKLLETVLEKNPNQDVQVAACFTLATLLKDEAQYGKNKKATGDAEKLFERVVMEFANVRPSGPNLARKAKTELSELRRLTIGKLAPDFEAEDLDGQEIKLTDYRGKVVVVAFWSTSTVDSLDEHQKLFEPLHEKPFAYISINCDNDLAKAKATIEKHQIAWPTIWDGRSGPVAAEWNINLWTSVFILDRHGVIRHRQLRGKELVTAIETLLREGS